MTQVKNYGPSVVLGLLVVAVLFGGPRVMRDIAFAETQGQVAAADEALEKVDLLQLSQAFRAIAKRTKPSVVHISVERRATGNGNVPDELWRRFGLPRGDDEGSDLDEFNAPQLYGSGSGWVYDKQGHIITNAHVIEDADVIRVRFHDDSSLKAELVAVDKKTDIAVIKVKPNRELHPATIDTKPVEQGDIVFAFGSPFQFEFSMSQGIVSGKGRQLGILDERDGMGRRIASGYENFIQTDAAINRGNSGGPLVDVRGSVVGMNTAIASTTGGNHGLGFAIPAAMIKRYVPQLIENKEVKRGYLGVAITDDAKLLRSFGVEHGVVIDNLLPDGPAGEAGLKIEDVIVEIDGKKVRGAHDLRTLIADYGPDATIMVTVIRDGERVTRTVKLVEQPDVMRLAGDPRPQRDDSDKLDEDQLLPLRKLGLEEVTDMTEPMADKLNVEFRKGVFIEDVRRGSVAATEGVGPGMLITRVGSEDIEDVADLVEALDEADLKEGVRIRVAAESAGKWLGRSVVLQLPE